MPGRRNKIERHLTEQEFDETIHEVQSTGEPYPENGWRTNWRTTKSMPISCALGCLLAHVRGEDADAKLVVCINK